MAINNLNLHSIRYSLNFSTYLSKFNVFWKIKIALFIFSLYLMFEGLFGVQIGILNPAITVIWIGWWMIIVLLFLPFNAKSWCSICPVPILGQIYNRYAPLNWLSTRKFNKKLGFFGFLPVLLFLLFSAVSVPISTIPFITGFILLLLFLSSTFIDSFYGERTFCKEICPINPLLQTYNNLSRISLRTIDFTICATDHVKTCMIGDANSFGCDWGFFPGKLKANENDCTNCCDCVKSCNYNNLELIARKTKSFPEDYEKLSWVRSLLPIFFLGIAITYSITKIATIEPLHRFILINGLYDIVLSLLSESFTTLLVIPSLFIFLVVIPLFITIKNDQAKMILIKRSSFVSIPLSLAIWIIFTLYLILPNIDLLLLTFSDPFNLNWNILNLKSVKFFSGAIKEIINPLGQVILIIGYYYSLINSYKLIATSNISLPKQFGFVLCQFIFYSLIFISISLIYL